MTRERVYQWFNEAKRALADAQGLCSAARTTMLSAQGNSLHVRIVDAKYAFLLSEFATQTKILNVISYRLVTARKNVLQSFEATLGKLDVADAELNQKFSNLRNTSIDKAFASESDTKTLFDFVDDKGIEGLREKLRGIIDSMQTNFEMKAEVSNLFQAEVEVLMSKFHELESLPSNWHIPMSSFQEIEDEGPHPICLEVHVDQIAFLLEALANHYDQCQRAVKDIEMVSPEEFDELTSVLEGDHAESQSVIQELQNRVEEMQAVSRLMHLRRAQCDQNYNQASSILRDAMVDFEKTALDGHLSEASRLQKQLEDDQAQMELWHAELDGLVNYYDRFAEAYDSMILEVGRRIGVRARSNAILNDALKKVQAIAEEEAEVRSAFCHQNGDFLPSDLWPGLLEPPQIFKVVSEGQALPNISNDLLESAMKRLELRNPPSRNA